MSAFSPLTHRTFRWLWTATVVANIGMWMQSLGAQWFLVSDPGSASLVALVQVALTAPMAILALPAGVLADNVNRRTLLISVQSATLVVGLVLTVLMLVGALTPVTLLLLTALLGCGQALTLTPFQSLIPDLVSRERIQPAAGLVGIGANIARIVGPAVAGLLVAQVGIGAVFAMNAASTAVLVTVLARWKPAAIHRSHREHFFPAVRTGVRYVRHSPQVLKLMLRSFWFTSPMMAIFALLPLVATERLGMGSGGYGILFALLGAGAVVGGISVTRLRYSMSTNAIVGIGAVLAALVIAALPFVTVPAVAMALMFPAGAAWTASNAAMSGAMQVYLPAWVRARGLALFSVALFGGQAIGSLVVGWAAHSFGLDVAFAGAAVVMAAGATFALWLPLKELQDIDRTPTAHWPEPVLVVDPDELGGEVAVSISYWIDPEDEAEFSALMEHVRRTRLRTGGNSWRLLKDGEIPRRFVEEYSVGSWQEHEYQHHWRLVASDKEWEDKASALSDPPREIQHLFRLDVRRTGWR